MVETTLLLFLTVPCALRTEMSDLRTDINFVVLAVAPGHSSKI